MSSIYSRAYHYVYLWRHGVGGDPGRDLDDEDDPEEDGEGEDHAVVVADGAAAAEEGDGEDDLEKDINNANN